MKLLFALWILVGAITSLQAQSIDYSYCGYQRSESPIPTLPVNVIVSPQTGDNHASIQQAIDLVSGAKPDANGFRGVVLLEPGSYPIQKSLRITTSGVVLRGRRRNEVRIVKQGVERGALLYIEGRQDQIEKEILPTLSEGAQTGTLTLTLTKKSSLAVGDRLIIHRHFDKEWIEKMGCNEFGGGISALGWKPGDVDLYWDRTITAIEGNTIRLCAPLPLPTDPNNTTLRRYCPTGRIANSGVENLTLLSEYNPSNPKDEDHAWTGISIENAENCWVRQIDFNHFAGSTVVLQPSTMQTTVEDCRSFAPVSEIGGMRRTTFFNMGQLNLFQRCYSEQGYHDFAIGYCAPGPNAFVQCDSYESFSFSGPIDAWSPGLLYDVVNIDGHNLSFKNLGQERNGAGWNTAGSTFWQCTASGIECYKPPYGEINRTIGCWAQFSGDGEWKESNSHVRPRSHFYDLLAKRLNRNIEEQARILPRNTDASSSPTVEQAERMAAEAQTPRMTLHRWIEQAPTIVSDTRLARPFTPRQIVNKIAARKPVITIEEGVISKKNSIISGRSMNVPWWSMKLRTPHLRNARPHVTRFVPDREGNGLTDRIDTVVNQMAANNITILDHNYGLWYDRRRDDHERVRRRNGDAWGPFYEQPFSRSGIGTAWDGLSKYDLTKPNRWYWSRLAEFADKAEEKGILLFHQNYFQHNIIEAGAHWVDSPWRPTNNINETGFNEPVNFAGDKRVFVADEFYNINHPTRRALHRTYIRECLSQLADRSNVVQLISEEYTGPLHFVEFWLDVIAEWRAETGKKATVALSTTKDVQDAILNNPKRAAQVDIIDIRYWHYKQTGELYAPKGGQNLAPRQHARKTPIGKVSAQSVYRSVAEYRKQYPNKAVCYFGPSYPDMGWAILTAGGSLPNLPGIDPLLEKAAQSMQPVFHPNFERFELFCPKSGHIFYLPEISDFTLELQAGRYKIHRTTSKKDSPKKTIKTLNINNKQNITIQSKGDEAIWIEKIK